MNHEMASGAVQRLVEQLGESLFDQPGMTLTEQANRVRELRGDGPALLVDGQTAPAGQIDAETLWWLQDAINTMAEGGNQSHVRFLQRLHDTLSAQPSTGGQGDAPWPEIDMILADAYSAGAEGLQFEGIARRAAVRAAVSARAARQPVRHVRLPQSDLDLINEAAARKSVGEPVAYIEHFADKVSRMEMTMTGLHLRIGRHPVYAAPPAQQRGEPVAWMDPDGSRVLTAKAKANASGAYKSATSGYTVPLYPPAQAVDLGRVRASLQSLLHWIDDWAETPEESGIAAIEAEAEAVLALIDGKAVGK